jgi:hypothetical protein
MRLAFERETQRDKECLHRFEIVDNDQDVVHALDGHVLRSLLLNEVA